MYPMARSTRTSAPRRRGFTLMEMAVATSLLALLGVLLASAVATFARPANEVDHRTRVAIEANLAAEALARDLGGYLADSQADPGTLIQYQLSTSAPWSCSSDNKVLSLTFTKPGSPDVTVTYQMNVNHQLERISNLTSPSLDTVIAGHLADFSAYLYDKDGHSKSPVDYLYVSGDYVRIEMTLAYYPAAIDVDRKGNFSGTYVLIGALPPP
jgi:prepilin-type N-terminal cleavage/methylation domain-containing protein